MKLARLSASQEAARHKRLYDRRAGVVELRPGDKVLVHLDGYRGARQKLKNRWGGKLHTVVRRIAEDVPAYVIRNDKGEDKILHQAHLLLWSSVEEEDGLQMTVAQLTIFASLSGLEPLPKGEDRGRVPYEWSINGFGLNLASFQPTTDAPELKTEPNALATSAETPLKEGVGQWNEKGEGTNFTRDGDTVRLEDAPPWTGTHRVEPNLLVPGGKRNGMSRLSETTSDHAPMYTIRQCAGTRDQLSSPTGLFKRWKDRKLRINGRLNDSFFTRFFLPTYIHVHASTRACLFFEGGGYMSEVTHTMTRMEDRRTPWPMRDGRRRTHPFPLPYVGQRMHRHPQVVKPLCNYGRRYDVDKLKQRKCTV